MTFFPRRRTSPERERKKMGSARGYAREQRGEGCAIAFHHVRRRPVGRDAARGPRSSAIPAGMQLARGVFSFQPQRASKARLLRRISSVRPPIAWPFCGQSGAASVGQTRSEERRVGKEWRSRWWRYDEKKKIEVIEWYVSLRKY